jgi:hypothetical protein
MALKQTLEAAELLDRPDADGALVARVLRDRGLTDVTVARADGAKGGTDYLKVIVPGTANGRTLGIIGRLGGIGARPARLGLVSDADGAIVAIAAALKLADMKRVSDDLAGPVIITTNICPDAPTRPYSPVPRMSSPLDTTTKNRHEVDPRMEAIVSVDATKGNDILNIQGIAITPTVKEGWVLRVSPAIAALLSQVTGSLPSVLPITTQDITAQENGVYHINSIVQPAIATVAPVIGLALTTVTAVPGSATGANRLTDLEAAARFCVELAKEFTSGALEFFDHAEWSKLVALYGPLSRFQDVVGQDRDAGLAAVRG